MLNWNVAVFAEDDTGCEWKTFEETDTYIMENCTHPDGGYQARVRQKPVEGLNIIKVEAPKKKANPIKEFKDKVEQAPKIAEKIEKIEKVEQEVIVTEKKVKELKEEKSVAEKVEEHLDKKELHETPVKDTEKPIVKEEIAKVEEDKKADEKLVKNVQIFDVFEGEAIGNDKKSLAIKVTLQASDRTLNETEIQAVSKKIVDLIEQKTAGVVRS